VAFLGESLTVADMSIRKEELELAGSSRDEMKGLVDTGRVVLEGVCRPGDTAGDAARLRKGLLEDSVFAEREEAERSRVRSLGSARNLISRTTTGAVKRWYAPGILAILVER
jgi:hypothetical protein